MTTRLTLMSPNMSDTDVMRHIGEHEYFFLFVGDVCAPAALHVPRKYEVTEFLGDF